MKFSDAKNQPLMRLFSYIPPYKKTLFFAVLAMIVSASGSSLMVLLMGKLTDLGFYQKNGLVAMWAPIALIGISVLHGGGQFASGYLLQTISQSVLFDIRNMMFKRMIHWPDEAIQGQHSGRVVSRFLNEASTSLSNASEVLTVLVRDSIQVVALLVVLLWYNWFLTIITFVVAPVLVFILRTVSRKMKKITHSSQQNYGLMIQLLTETFHAQRLVKIYDAYDFENKRFREINGKMKKLALKSQLVKGLGTPCTQLVVMCGVAIVVFVALMQAQADTFSLSDFVTYIAAMLMLMNPIRKLADLNGSIAKMQAAAESLYSMIDIPEEKDPGTSEIDRVSGNVEFRNVCYQYPGAPRASLKNFSLNVKAGQMVAFVGSSGAGKTTVINMIPRFLVPNEGEILFDGVSQNEMKLSAIRKQIALVTQDVILFDDTIAANIAYGCNRHATREEIIAAAEAAYLMPFIESLPEGLDTKIGEKGAKLSGGQRQRVSIARALLKNAPILLLDEATSALDTESEKYIQASLERLMDGRTSFVVAHRLSTIVNADMIVVLSEGQIVETGTHSELLQKGGVYANLYRIQFDREAEAEQKAAAKAAETAEA